MLFLHCISSFEGINILFINICKIQPDYSFLVVITSADIIFEKFLELHSTSSEKKRFSSRIFLFLTDSRTPHPPPPPHTHTHTHKKETHPHPHPLYNDQNPLSVTKVFCRCFLNAVITIFDL